MTNPITLVERALIAREVYTLAGAKLVEMESWSNSARLVLDVIGAVLSDEYTPVDLPNNGKTFRAMRLSFCAEHPIWKFIANPRG